VTRDGRTDRQTDRQTDGEQPLMRRPKEGRIKSSAVRCRTCGFRVGCCSGKLIENDRDMCE